MLNSSSHYENDESNQELKKTLKTPPPSISIPVSSNPESSHNPHDKNIPSSTNSSTKILSYRLSDVNVIDMKPHSPLQAEIDSLRRKKSKQRLFTPKKKEVKTRRKQKIEDEDDYSSNQWGDDDDADTEAQDLNAWMHEYKEEKEEESQDWVDQEIDNSDL